MKRDNSANKAIEKKFGRHFKTRLGDERITNKTYEDSLFTDPETGLPMETARANPDVFAEDARELLLPESQHSKDERQKIKDNQFFAINNCKLTDKQRMILNLLEKGLTQEEIADKLKVKRTAVENALQRARLKIKKFYESTRVISDNR